MEEAAAARDVVLIPGGELIGPDHLADGIHPDDEGHRILANVIGAEVAKAVFARSVVHTTTDRANTPGGASS